MQRLCWTADGEGALPELGPYLQDNSSCVSCGGTELSASRLFTAKFDHVAEICLAALTKNGVHHGGDLEFNSCFHRQRLSRPYRRLGVCPVIQSKDKPSGHVLYTLQRCQSRCRISPYVTELTCSFTSWIILSQI